MDKAIQYALTFFFILISPAFLFSQTITPTISASNYNSPEIQQDSLQNKEESRKIKATVSSISPIGAKIGKKEGLKIDQLFKVTEYREDKQGEMKERRVGFVRAKRIADNRYVATDNRYVAAEDSVLSTFYKAPSNRITKGMTLTEEPEFGMMLGLDVGLGFTSDMHTAAYMGVTAEQITRLWKGSRALIGMGVVSTFSYSNMFLMTAELKQDIQLNRFSLAPSVGLGYTYKSKDLHSAGVVLGIKTGLNLGKHFQIHTGLRLFRFFNNAAVSGIYMSAGLRVFGF